MVRLYDVHPDRNGVLEPTRIVRTPDWHDKSAYAYITRLRSDDLAWEFLRRNPDFRNFWHSYRSGTADPASNESRYAGVRDVPYVQEARKWGLLNLPSPDQDARSATVFWDPAACRRVIHTFAIPAGSPAFAPFNVTEVAADKSMVVDHENVAHVVLRRGDARLQIAISGAHIVSRVVLLTEAIIPFCEIGTRFEALERLSRICDQNVTTAKRVNTVGSIKRLSTILQATDARLAGATHREIAVALFGLRWVAQDWRNHDGCLRGRTRRAVARGLTLLRGGYRSLLR
jgi:hypothetical protein